MVIFLQYLSVIHERSLRTDGIPTLFSGGDTVHGNEGVSRSPRSFSSSYFLLHMRPVCRRGAQITVGTRYLYSKRRRFCDNIYPVILIYIHPTTTHLRPIPVLVFLDVPRTTVQLVLVGFSPDSPLVEAFV